MSFSTWFSVVKVFLPFEKVKRYRFYKLVFERTFVRVATSAVFAIASYLDGGKSAVFAGIIMSALFYVANDSVVEIIHKEPPLKTKSANFSGGGRIVAT